MTTIKLPTTRWAFDLSTWSPTLPQLAQAVAAIQPEERARLIKFHFINDFLSSLVGRLLMRKFVSQCTELPFEKVQFARDSRQKPYWQREDDNNMPQLSFNVSHQGKFVILAGVINTTNMEYKDFGIGCDVVKLEYSGGRDLKEFFRIMNRKFSESEWRYITQPHFNQQQQLKAFMRHWCLKESYVKELGVGITVDLQKIAFTVAANKDLTLESQPLCDTTLKCNDLPMNQWYFEEHMMQQKYCAAIAFRNFQPETTEKFEFLKITELIYQHSLPVENLEILEYCRNVLKKPIK